MMRNPASSLALALLLGTTALAGTAFAQSTPPSVTEVPPAATPVVPPAASSATPAEVPAAKSDAAKAGHHHGSNGMNTYLQRLHDQLKITAAEEPLWGSFADVMRDGAAATGQAYRDRRSKLQGFTATQDMDSFIAVEQQRLDTLKKSSAAFATLYASMPPDQQKLADTLFRSELPGGPHAKRKP
jgi:protein CpxP